ncbi:MAG: AgmX/PglI C-terminal domain-containing protein [Sandaracinus sp.]|nr:AgmX/PglI C-terminal domain-containing protein [Myxococcales bacterium]MCB9619659.1 AgmX/PglI C-terminal domain-containing protein [Sandaracinus sp.]
MRLFALALALAVPALGQAQSPNVDEARGRAMREVACLERVQREVTTQVQLLREAHEQLSAPYEDVRSDAARAVESIEQRLDELAEAMRACLPRTSRLETREVVNEPTGSAAAVGVANAATEVVERDVQLSGYVTVRVGERVDGRGNLAASEVRAMVRGAAGRIAACYGDFVEREALETGTIIVAWTVDGSGRILRVTTEAQQVGDASFARCVERAASGMRGRRPSGGDVRYAYTLRFGP